MKTLETSRADPDGFDIVVTDQAMPDLSGGELAQELMRVRPGLPIVIVTGHSEIMTPEKAKELGLRGYISKPYTVVELTRVIGEALDAAT